MNDIFVDRFLLCDWWPGLITSTIRHHLYIHDDDVLRNFY